MSSSISGGAAQARAFVEQRIGYCTSDACAAAAAARSRRLRARDRAEAPAPEDTGADGPAMSCRPRRTVVLPGEGGGIGRERFAVDRLLDAHVIDRMWDRGQLDDRQHGAASRLYAVFCRAGLEPRFVAEPGERRGGGGGAAEMDEAMAEARAEYNRLVARHPGRTGELLDSMCHGRHPGTFFLAALQGALDELARQWGERRAAPAH